MKRELLVMGFMVNLGLASCTDRMEDQPRYEALESSTFFLDGKSARHLVDGTIPRGRLETDAHLTTGRVDGKLVATFPYEMGREELERGRERYDIFCSVCHGRTGYGDGMVWRRGLKTKPASFHDPRLRDAAVGHFFEVITHGFGAMPEYGYMIPIEDRWAIAAYIRALQLAANVDARDLAPQDMRSLERAPR